MVRKLNLNKKEEVMKRIIFTVLAILTLSCAPFISINTSSNITNAFALRRMTLINNSNYVAKITINCATTPNIPPKGILTSTWIYDFDEIQVPITIQFFDSKNQYVGTAQRVLYYYPSLNNTWVISNEDINYVDDSSIKRHPFPQSKATTAFKFKFPRINWLSTTIIQIANNNTHEATILINGKIRAILKEGDVYCVDLQQGNFFEYYEVTNITALYGDKSFSQDIYSYPNIESAYVFSLF